MADLFTGTLKGGHIHQGLWEKTGSYRDGMCALPGTATAGVSKVSPQ